MSVRLVAGDILFQDLNCGAICDAIDGATSGFGGAEISHCGVVDQVGRSRLVVIEAILPSVRIVDLDSFLNRFLDDAGRPRIMVGRATAQIQHLVPGMLEFCRRAVGLPYDVYFANDEAALYCSELIVDGFQDANDGIAVFPETPMTFKSPDTGEVLEFWRQYFLRLNAPVPEGMPGSNPGPLSRDPQIRIVEQLGSLNGRPLL